MISTTFHRQLSPLELFLPEPWPQPGLGTDGQSSAPPSTLTLFLKDWLTLSQSSKCTARDTKLDKMHSVVTPSAPAQWKIPYEALAKCLKMWGPQTHVKTPLAPLTSSYNHANCIHTPTKTRHHFKSNPSPVPSYSTSVTWPMPAGTPQTSPLRTWSPSPSSTCFAQANTQPALHPAPTHFGWPTYNLPLDDAGYPRMPLMMPSTTAPLPSSLSPPKKVRSKEKLSGSALSAQLPA